MAMCSNRYNTVVKPVFLCQFFLVSSIAEIHVILSYLTDLYLYFVLSSVDTSGHMCLYCYCVVWSVIISLRFY